MVMIMVSDWVHCFVGHSDWEFVLELVLELKIENNEKDY